MTVEVKAEAVHVAESVVLNQEEAVKVETVAEQEVEVQELEETKAKIVEKSSSFKEESNFLSDLKEFEKKALNELKSKLEEAIIDNTLFKKPETKEPAKSSKQSEEKEERNKEKASEKSENQTEEEKKEAKEAEVSEEEKKPEEGIAQNPEPAKIEVEEEEKKAEVVEEEKIVEVVDKDISLWGVPLLPSKGADGTNVVLLKFLRAREFKVNEALEMLKKTLIWRKESKIDSILDEDLGSDLGSAAYIGGTDRKGHPICYNIFGLLDKEEMFGTEEKRGQFFRWRFQLMEKGIQKLDFKAGGVNSLIQINDLKNSPGPSKKEVRIATKQAVAILQDNYPEFVAKNIFINAPFWYYAFNALLSPFLTQRTKSKFVVSRPAKVTETLLKYIPIEEIPIQYGGLRRENDFEFSAEDGTASELIIKAGSTKTIEIPATEAGATFIWDLTALGWDVSYKEEFIPTDEGSYAIIIHKEKKLGTNEVIRNTFWTHEPGKIVLTIDNNSSKKRKKALYRHKIKKRPF